MMVWHRTGIVLTRSPWQTLNWQYNWPFRHPSSKCFHRTVATLTSAVHRALESFRYRCYCCCFCRLTLSLRFGTAFEWFYLNGKWYSFYEFLLRELVRAMLTVNFLHFCLAIHVNRSLVDKLLRLNAVLKLIFGTSALTAVEC